MKIWKALIVLLVGPIIGAVVGLIGAGFEIPSDPTGRGTPGDGIGLILGMVMGMGISGILSVVAVAGMKYRADKAKNLK